MGYSPWGRKESDKTERQGFGLSFQLDARVEGRLAAGDPQPQEEGRVSRLGWTPAAKTDQQPGRAVGSACLSCVWLGRQGFSGCFRPFVVFDFHGL